MPKEFDAADIRSEFAGLSTIRDALRYAVSAFTRAGLHFGHGSANALDEAAFLILESLNLPIDDINPWLDARLAPRELAMLGERVALRAEKRIPAAYLTGRSYLHGFPFRSDARALAPRSFIADLLFSRLFDGSGDQAALISDPDTIESVLDLCTGGGSLAILATHAFPHASVDAADLSAEALALASENIADYGLEERIALHRGDLFGPLAGRRFDLILTNPPYVDKQTMDTLPPEFLAEPAMALDGGEDGFDLVRKIIDGAAAHLNPGGGILCEIGLDREILEAYYPAVPFFWLDTDGSEGEVFWLERADLPGAG